MLKKISIGIIFLLIISTNASAEWYKDCSNKKVEDSMIKIYETNFHTFHQISFYEWVVHEVKYKTKPYKNANSYFGQNKNVCSSTFTVIAQSINDLKKHKFEIGFSMLFKGTKNNKGEDLFDSRLDYSNQIY
ncbi:hypothetical protein [Poseidonibacter sp.]|uniref:hypothetical protein n=1 Tax=Poseidonibacter sp. TaxID=2321188 RepID=UPI003C772D52